MLYEYIIRQLLLNRKINEKTEILVEDLYDIEKKP